MHGDINGSFASLAAKALKLNAKAESTRPARAMRFSLGATGGSKWLALPCFCAAALITQLAPSSALANSSLTVSNGSSDLTDPGTYFGTPPGSTTDVEFASGTVYAPTAFTVNNAFNLSIGTLNDLDSSQTLTINNNGTASASTITLNGGSNSVSPAAGDLLYVASGGTLSIGNASGAGDTLGLALTASGNFNVVGTANINSVISDAGAGFTKTGNGTLTLSGSNTYSGGTTLNAGTLVLGSGAALGTGTLTINGGTLQFLLNGTLANNNNFLATNSFSVSTHSSSGSNFYLNTGTGKLMIGQAITITVAGADNGNSGEQGLVISNVITDASGGNTLNALDVTWQFNGNSTQGLTLSAPITLRANQTLNTLGVSHVTSDFVVQGAIGDGGAGYGVTFVNSGAQSPLLQANTRGPGVFLTGANTYTGTTTLNTGAVVSLGKDSGSVGSLSPSSAITNNGILGFDRGNTLTQGTDFGTISGSGAIVQWGNGTTVLTASNTYTGQTAIGNGTIKLSSSSTNNIANSTSIYVVGSIGNGINGGTLDTTGLNGGSGLILASGQSIYGSGTVHGALTVASGSIISADTGVSTSSISSTGGTLKTGNVTLNAGGTYNWKTNQSTSSWTNKLVTSSGSVSGQDMIDVSSSGTLAIATGTNLKIVDSSSNAALVPGDSFIIANVASGGTITVGGSAVAFPTSGSPTTAIANAFVITDSNSNSYTYTADAIYDSGNGGADIEVNISATPEPGSLGLLGLASLGLLRRRRSIRKV